MLNSHLCTTWTNKDIFASAISDNSWTLFGLRENIEKSKENKKERNLPWFGLKENLKVKKVERKFEKINYKILSLLIERKMRKNITFYFFFSGEIMIVEWMEYRESFFLNFYTFVFHFLKFIF